ncbi:long-chain-fatty-acid--CoA ligase [Desulfatitalea alkaliphila]|uniref:Long-chain fatty acid--CoA ligase n=1 Tax=Desulfatitalea alkaliphila TaxID=2929485 RepID=A0AA41R881_9BACT|nr:long-chain fatty acid--CoA ligase [Desulfatitalea alkaliphila]MCJ8502825.1 long-chain fatty acid--CoA ligase [Desulfatitalea alkaliphila]
MTQAVRYEDKPWLKHYQKGVPEFVDFEDKCLPDFLDRSVSRFPDKTALIFEGYKINYTELKDMVDRFATCLHRFGVRKGDAVAILLPNMIPCVAAFYAIHRIGAIAVMNNPLYSDRELEHQFNDSGSKVLITIDLLAARMVALRPKTKIKQIVYTSIGDYLPFPKSLLFPLVGKKKGLKADVQPADELFRWKDLIAQTPPEPPKVELSFDDVAIYQYTGGTTGVSKGAVLTHGNLSRQVQQGAAWFPHIDSNNVGIGALPFFHVFGLTSVMNIGLFFGWTLVLVPKPQPPQLVQTLKKYKITFAALVPTMYIGILQEPGIESIDMSSIENMFSGSAPLPVEVIKDFEKRTGGIIVEGYGLTETSPMTHINPCGEGSLRKVGSIGLPICDTLCRIVDVNDGQTEVPVGESGELLIKGPQVMRGYLNRPEATAETITDGWLHTGDIATMDEDGYFYIIDRKKDLVISGGYNIYPRDIEEVYFEHPKVVEASAIGVPHASRGETVKVFIVLREGETATEEEMIAYCHDKLAKYKWPTEIEFRKELPKTNVGKVLKKDLRAEEMKQRGDKK